MYLCTILFSLLFLFFGARANRPDPSRFPGRSDAVLLRARVTEVLERKETTYRLEGSDSDISKITVIFYARPLGTDAFGDSVEAVQEIDGLVYGEGREVAVGDRVLLTEVRDDFSGFDWYFASFSRIEVLAVLGLAFAAALVAFGLKKGVNTLISLVFTFGSIFVVFVPAVLSGKNIYLWTFVTAFFIVPMTFLIVNGPDFKTLTAVLGCFSGLCVAGLLTKVFGDLLRLTGIVDEESVYLADLIPEKPIDLKAVVFAAVVIGALGAVTDTAMSVASALWELKESGVTGRRALFVAGVNIGRDMVSTMTATLLLAYIGGSLATVLLLTVYRPSLTALLNMEMIVTEILQALVGGAAILFTVPFTALICALLFRPKPEPEIE